jgi:hypothetical protein
MKYKYEQVVKQICGENWETDEVSSDERDGGYGVAICLAHLNGAAPKLTELSDYLGTPPQTLEVAYKRLQINGIFSKTCTILDDQELLFTKAVTDEELERSHKAWCHIAGLASGFVGKASLRSDMSRKNERK